MCNLHSFKKDCSEFLFFDGDGMVIQPLTLLFANTTAPTELDKPAFHKPDVTKDGGLLTR